MEANKKAGELRAGRCEKGLGRGQGERVEVGVEREENDGPASRSDLALDFPGGGTERREERMAVNGSGAGAGQALSRPRLALLLFQGFGQGGSRPALHAIETCKAGQAAFDCLGDHVRPPFGCMPVMTEGIAAARRGVSGGS